MVNHITTKQEHRLGQPMFPTPVPRIIVFELLGPWLHSMERLCASLRWLCTCSQVDQLETSTVDST
jgi:hypothetical protein